MHLITAKCDLKTWYVAAFIRNWSHTKNVWKSCSLLSMYVCVSLRLSRQNKKLFCHCLTFLQNDLSLSFKPLKSKISQNFVSPPLPLPASNAFLSALILFLISGPCRGYSGKNRLCLPCLVSALMPMEHHAYPMIGRFISSIVWKKMFYFCVLTALKWKKILQEVLF